MGVLLPLASSFAAAFSSSLADVKANESCICGAGWRAGLSSMTFDVHARCIGAVMYLDRKPWSAMLESDLSRTIQFLGSASATSLACDSTMRSNPAMSTASCAITVLAGLQQYKAKQ